MVAPHVKSRKAPGHLFSMKLCPKCQKQRSLTGGFYRNRKTKDGLTSWCKSCVTAKSREWRSRPGNREKDAASSKARRERFPIGTTEFARDDTSKREHSLRHRYGIGGSEYAAILEAQCGGCAICKGPQTSHKNGRGAKRRLSVDHDHVTGEVRGLLCHHCNSLLGYAKDRPGTLAAALRYLKGGEA